ncbi:MAG: Zn-dependent exopeptidase M28, partial [Oscillospiraceae bacterium]|nr:Zn-dependent exopeptidase M28 [Oscillospiraceae bacterium]
LADKGALGYIMIGGDFYEEESIKHELRPSDAFGKDNPLPGLKMHIDDAEKLVRSKPTKVRMVLKNRKKKATAHNVIATIEGTDLKDEVIIFSAHCDSVPYSTGSWDNATGSVTVMELMHYFNKNKPRRTMKFLWCGAEEIGLVGSRKYCEAHKDELEKVIFNINFDMTGVTLGYEHVCCSCSEETMHAIQYLANVENYPLDIELGMYSSDSSSFAGAGVPACTFARLNPRGGAQIHNHHDTMEHLDPDSFMITANFVAKFASQIANSTVNPIPRKFADKVKKALEERKRFMPDEEKKDKKPAGKKGGKKEEKPAEKDSKKADKK